MLQIWRRRNSINVQKVQWCVEELGIAYLQIDAGMSFGINNEAWYLEKTRNGLVPMIDHDGKVLWESNAIIRYLAAQYGRGALCPTDAHVHAEGDMWMDWQLGMIKSGLEPVLLQLVRTPPEKRDIAAIKTGEAQLRKTFASLDGHLASCDFLTGDAFTMADIAVGCAASRWYLLEIEQPDLPNLRSWFGRISARAPFKKSVRQFLI